ncbi:MAG TPA: hypothetical protein VNZ26_03910, partial [Vicinamibacterales bacterium]|nr:hypothetical protein [Vicinamibacterales bacterium]
ACRRRQRRGPHRPGASTMLLKGLGIVAMVIGLIAAAGAVEPRRIAFSRVSPARIGLFLSDTDGGNERPLLPADGLDYNASFSYDGKWIVFTSERTGSADIFRVHSDGTGLERLTEDPSFDDQASLSPNGRTLAFVSTRGTGTADIWLLDLESHRYHNLTQHVGGDYRPIWSPDGKWIAFTSDRDTPLRKRQGGWESVQSTALYIVGSDGNGLRRLTAPGGFAGSPKWSLDGTRIVFYEATVEDSWRGRFFGGLNASSQIVSIEVATGARTQHTQGDGLKVSPQFVDAERIGFLIKTGTSAGLAITSGKRIASTQIRNPSWSADRRQIVYQKQLPDDGGPRPRVLAADPAFELILTGVFPDYSPSGDRLVATRMTSVVDGSLELSSSDGSQRRTIFAEKGKMAIGSGWSPDGRQIAFGLGGFFVPHQKAQIALIRPDGTDFRTITPSEGNSGFPSWSPDGTHIVYRVSSAGDEGLRIVSLKDGDISTLTTSHDTFPSWSPRGDRIAFTSTREGDFEIYTIKPDGSDVRRLTRSPGNDAHSVWSRDGKWIVFSSARNGFKDEGPLYDNIAQPYGELFLMREDGTGVRQLTDSRWENGTPSWQPRGAKD